MLLWERDLETRSLCSEVLWKDRESISLSVLSSADRLALLFMPFVDWLSISLSQQRSRGGGGGRVLVGGGGC